MHKLSNLDRKYENYRWFFTSEGVLAVGGKSDEQNESVIRNCLKPKYTIIHTTEPGSPFIILQSENVSKKDIEEAGIFCACFSKQWKAGKKEISVDIFRGSQVYKSKSMKTGTFGLKGDKKTLKVKPELVLIVQKGKLRAVPKTTKEETLAQIKQGKLTKEQASEKILKKIKKIYHFPFSKDEVMSAIPSDKLDVK